MAGGNEYEPKDSRNVTGTAETPDARWSGDAPEPGHGGEYEPRDSRNITGTAKTPDGRWTNTARENPDGAEDGTKRADDEARQPDA